MSNTRKPTGPRAVKRGIWFFMRTILLVVALCLLCYGIFNTAMKAANMYIIVTEGMQLRAECILQQGPTQELTNYFTESYLAKDSALAINKYGDYTITNFDYRISVGGLQVWPWSKSATITIVERMVNMNGVIHAEKRDPNAPEDTEYPLPEWQDGKYRVYFMERDGRWFIYQIILLDAQVSEEPKNTPNMSMSPIPAYKPTPAPAAPATQGE